MLYLKFQLYIQEQLLVNRIPNNILEGATRRNNLNLYQHLSYIISQQVSFFEDDQLKLLYVDI
jgi:hypothetical protein